MRAKISSALLRMYLGASFVILKIQLKIQLKNIQQFQFKSISLKTDTCYNLHPSFRGGRHLGIRGPVQLYLEVTSCAHLHVYGFYR